MLLVEDNSGDVTLIRETLRENGVGARLYVATDGEEAIDLIEQIDRQEVRCPDLILLDLNLPKRTGYEVLERLRSSPQCAQRPVVILSSSNAPQDKEQTTRLGATKYITKPSSLEDLMNVGLAVRELLMKGSSPCRSE